MNYFLKHFSLQTYYWTNVTGSVISWVDTKVMIAITSNQDPTLHEIMPEMNEILVSVNVSLRLGSTNQS